MPAGLGCLFLFLLSIFFFLFVAVRNLLYVLFSPFRRASRRQSRKGDAGQTTRGRGTSDSGKRGSGQASGSRGKIFGKNEGEYVDFEEV